VAQLCRGRIIWVELLDPQGSNRKCRPAVVMTPDADVRDDGEVLVVAISTQLDNSLESINSEMAQFEFPLHRRPEAAVPGRKLALAPIPLT
jgi:mRNA-degrading endonuclease toxin of MazEF toxin-antitoxin module